MYRTSPSLEQKQRCMRERHGSGRGTDSNPVGLDFRQRHYTVPEVADMWNLSPDAVRRLFEIEPGVLVLGDNGRRGTRRYTVP